MTDVPPAKSALPGVFMEWLQTGKFLGIRLGSTRHECLETLGQPEDWSTMRSTTKRGKRVTSDNAVILKWSEFEFHFIEDNLFLIYSDWQQVLTNCFTKAVDGGIDINFMMNFLHGHGIEFSISESEESMIGIPKIIVYRFSLDYGIKLIFYEDDSNKVILQCAEQLLN